MNEDQVVEAASQVAAFTMNILSDCGGMYDMLVASDSLEDNRLLDSSSEKDIYALQYIFLPRLNS